MNKLAFFLGLAAVAFFLLSYQQKKRKNIILFSTVARILYIVQYIILSAYEGVVLNLAGIIATVFAQKKHTPFVKKNIKSVIIFVNLLIVITGLSVYKNVYSLLPAFGVLIQTGALWIDDEKRIRQLSLLGCPFWFAYNILSGAYGSCIGDIMTMTSLVVAMLRYDILPSKKNKV